MFHRPGPLLLLTIVLRLRLPVTIINAIRRDTHCQLVAYYLRAALKPPIKENLLLLAQLPIIIP